LPIRSPETTISIVSFCAGVPALVLLGREVAWIVWRRLAAGQATPRAQQQQVRSVTWAAAGAACALALLSGVTVVVLNGALHPFDQAVNHVFDGVRIPLLIRIWLFVTDMGSGGAILAVALVGSLLLWTSGRAALVAPLLGTALAAKVTGWVAKYVFALPRPVFVTEATAVSPSFPSDHAAGAMALYGFIACVVVRELEQPRARFEVAWWTALLIAAVGFSRLFLGVHYMSDVIAGYLLGGFWLLLGLMVATRRLP
jgi:membrane-associated phospholipid phosphatase